MLPPDTSHKYLPINCGSQRSPTLPRYLSITMGILLKKKNQGGVLVNNLADVSRVPVPPQVNIDEYILRNDVTIRVLDAERCIYCGSSNYRDGSGALTAEHVVPEGIGGNIVIGHASCYHCQTIINHYEARLQRVMLCNARNKLRLRKKDKKLTRKPSVITAIIEGKHSEVELPIEINPSFLVLPRYHVPRIIAVNPDFFGFNGLYVNAFENLGNLKDQEFSRFVTPTVDSQAFCQLLAKIAHSYAASKYGITWSEEFNKCRLGQFNATLLEIIKTRLGSSDDRLDFYTYVGQVQGEFGPSDALHQLGSSVIQHGNELFLAVYIRLFSYVEAPIYMVIAGRVNTS